MKMGKRFKAEQAQQQQQEKKKLRHKSIAPHMNYLTTRKEKL
jgi:hypothetical protein